MSKRRKGGDRVRLLPNSGFLSDSDRLPATIKDEPDWRWEPCLLECGDPDCREWETLWSDPDPDQDGMRWPLYHVSECQMLDPEESS